MEPRETTVKTLTTTLEDIRFYATKKTDDDDDDDDDDVDEEAYRRALGGCVVGKTAEVEPDGRWGNVCNE